MSSAIYVVARDPLGAKTRLAPALDAEARTSLAVAMLEDVLAAARGVDVDELVVATDALSLDAIAARGGATTLRLAPDGTNAAAAAAFRAASDRCRSAALVLAADLPLVTRADIVALFEAAAAAPVVIAPDRHGRGTNALFLTPPDAIAPAFGPGSNAAHREHATRAELPFVEIARRGLSHDVDEMEDLRLVLGDPALGARTRACLAELGARSLVSR